MNSNEIIADEKATASSSTGFDTLSTEQSEEEQSLEQADDNLYQMWVGAAGDNFRYASYTIELMLKEIAKRHHNTSEALNETLTRFSFLDGELSSSLTSESERTDAKQAAELIEEYDREHGIIY